MKGLETYFELAKLKSQAFELCHEKDETEERSDKRPFFLRLNSIIGKSQADNNSSIFKDQIQPYINEYRERELYKNETFEKELSVIVAIIDELKINFYRSEITNESETFKQEIQSLEDKLKNSGQVFDAYFKSKLFAIQLGILIAFLAFAIYGILKINAFEVNVEEISKGKIDEAKKQIEDATRKTMGSIDSLDKEYKSALFDLTKNNSSKYNADIEQYISSEKERVKSAINEHISAVKVASKPEIEKAIGDIQISIGSYNERLKHTDQAISENEKTLNNLDGKISSIKQNLVVIDSTLNKFKVSPPLNIVDKMSSVLNISRQLLWLFTVLLIIAFIWLMIISLLLRKKIRQQSR